MVLYYVLAGQVAIALVALGIAWLADRG
jgi:hypothetical protein